MTRTGRTRFSALPEIPTATEQGVESEPFRKRAEELGAKAVFMGSAELAKLDTSERSMWARTIKVSGIKTD